MLDPALRKPERLEAQYIHTQRRMTERYGLMISRTLYDRMCYQIRTKTSAECVAKYRRNDRFEVWLVRTFAQQIAVGWDTHYGTVATVLPKKILPKLQQIVEKRKQRAEIQKNIPPPPGRYTCPTCDARVGKLLSTGLCMDCHEGFVVLRKHPAAAMRIAQLVVDRLPSPVPMPLEIPVEGDRQDQDEKIEEIHLSAVESPDHHTG